MAIAGDQKIRWGIIGTGGIASTFAGDVALLTDAQVVAVGSRSQGSADEFADRFGIERRHPSYQALADDPDIDAVYVSTPHPMHHDAALLAIRAGKAAVATGHIERFTRDGIELKSGEVLPADIIVTATGLELQVLSDVALSVDGAAVDLGKTYNYKGMMFSDVPNLAAAFGYTNASWTLKADLTSLYVCRLLNAMRRKGMRQATPRVGGERLEPVPFLDFSSGYVRRSIDRFPKQGDRKPWRVHQNYIRDLMALKFGSVDDEMAFSNPVPKPVTKVA